MRRYILAAALLLTALAAPAQNLNPTVEVTNAFDGKLLDLHKPLQEMALPDSLTKFDLNFDYSIFDNPYKGVYEFKPYFVDMTPQPDAYDGNKLYLRLGAGYPLRPVFDFVWSPLPAGGPFTLNVYASHNSYIGSYRNIYAARKNGENRLQSNHENGEPLLDNPTTDGYDVCNKAGVNGLLEWNGGGFSFDAYYYGLLNNLYEKSVYNAADITLGVKSKDRGGTFMYYDANLNYRFSSDRIEALNPLNIHDIRAYGTFGPVLESHNRLLIDADLALAIYGGLFDASIGDFSFTPRYVLSYRGINLSVGARVAIPIHEGTDSYGKELNPGKGQFVYPAIHADFVLWKDRLDLYTDITGGEDIHRYSDLKGYNHFFNAGFGRGIGPLTELSFERVNARLGLRGNILNRFRFDVSGGWKYTANGLLEAVGMGLLKSGNLPDYIVPAVTYGNYQMAFADLKMVYDGKPVLVEGILSWKWTDMLDRGLTGFEPSPLTAFLRGTYSWRDRIKTGLYLDMALGRSGLVAPLPTSGITTTPQIKVPGFVDLGVFAEFAINRHLSLWVEGGNLLNQTIQRVPVFTSSGISGRLGIALVF